MRARPRKRPRPHGREQSPKAHTKRSARAPPAHVPREAPYLTPARKHQLSRGLRFAPAAEDQAAQGEAEPEGADRETANRKGLSPGGQPLPAAERLAFLGGQRLAPALLPDRAARPETEIEVVEDLGRIFGHANQSIA